MDAKSYLQQYPELVRQEKHLRSEADYGLRKLKELGACNYLLSKSDRIKSNEKNICIEQYCLSYLKQADDLHDRQLEILEVIKSIPDVEGAALYARFVDCLTWEQICEQTNYSWSGIHYVMDRALKMVQERLDEMDHSSA